MQTPEERRRYWSLQVRLSRFIQHASNLFKATSRKESLDPALLRPGRLDLIIELGLLKSNASFFIQFRLDL